MFNKDLIVKLLDEKQMSAYKLWKLSGVAQSTISDILNGKQKNPSAKTLTKLADALNVSVNDFFDKDTYMSREQEYIEDKDIRRIERARNKMSPKDKDKMMKILEASFDDFFDDDEN